jgi:nitrogen-specific signal transduction histidine kinase
MQQKQIFFDIYKNISTRRIIIMSVLFLFVIGVLFYFNQISKVLEEREKAYVDLFAKASGFLIEQQGADCDYTFISEVIQANTTVPVIGLTDEEIVMHRNIPELSDTTRVWSDEERVTFLKKKLEEMKAQNEPLQILSQNNHHGFVYYANSTTLKRLRFFPYIILGTLFLFGGLAYISYSSSRKAEQNRVWVGLAKETAHQLGTPISGLMGWIEVLKTYPDFDQSIGDEMMKDITRLETITARFSNIGSVPTMKSEDVGELVESTAEYLKKRISTKIKWEVTNNLNEPYLQDINKHLIEWVIENICKNAVDAMAGVGELKISIDKFTGKKIKIDIADTGKGMTMNVQRNIFNAGYSTKKRGWGLGLTLAKRIIETYHHGRLYVSKSEVGKGTTFRIIL